MANSPQQNSAPPPKAGLRARLGKLAAGLRQLPAWGRKHPVRALAAAAIFVAAPILLAVLGWSFAPVTTTTHVTLAEALEALDAGEYDEARRLAMAVYSDPATSYRDKGGPLYVLGMSIIRDADEHWNQQEQTLLHLVAAKYLQEAEQRDFPEGRATDAHFHLGRSWHLAGEHAKSISPLLTALEQGSPHGTEIARLLAESYLRTSPPKYEESLQQNRVYLSDAALPDSARHAALLREVRIHLALGDLASARSAIEQIPITDSLAAEQAIVEGQVLLAEGDALLRQDPPETAGAESVFQLALKILRSAPSSDPLTPGPPPAAQYLLGLCHERLDDAAAAEAQFTRVRRQYPDSAESFAAALHEVELLARRDNFDEAVKLIRKTLSDHAFSLELNPWVTPRQVQESAARLHQSILDRGGFDAALELANSPPGAIPAWQLTLWKAHTHEARAVAAERLAESVPLLKARELRAQARADRRQAGHEYAELAELRAETTDYTDDLWKSTEQFFAGQNYTRAVAMTQQYLQNESRKRRPDALLLLAQSRLALDQADSALETLADCIESFPRHPATYRARIVAAQASAEKGLLSEAKELLKQNVENDVLSPRSIEWRDSLFLLGNLLYREGLEAEAKSRSAGVDDPDIDRTRAGLKHLEQAHTAFRGAIDQLGEAIERYPQAPQVREAMYWLADAHRQASKWPRKRMKVVTIEATRAALSRQSQQELLTAVNEYDRLITQLGDVQDSPNHTQLEKRILRNGYFAKADALFDLGRFDDAIKAYSAATNRYQNDPESLEAYVQIAACYRLLERPGEARGTLEQAKVVLKRMKPDANFTQATPYTRDEWEQLITWLATL